MGLWGRIPSLPHPCLLHSRAVVQGENWLPIVHICHHQVHLYTDLGVCLGKESSQKKRDRAFRPELKL